MKEEIQNRRYFREAVNTALTVSFYVAFGLLCLILLFQGFGAFLKTALICGISFLGVSVFRSIYNAPRPCELNPKLVPPPGKERKGESFPSRHSFSAFLIAVCWFKVLPSAAVLLLFLAAVLSYLRYDLNFHSIKDVLWGSALGILFGIISLFF